MQQKNDSPLKRALYMIDIFGFNLTFRNKGFTKYKTRIGGIFTILVIISCITFFFYVSKDLFYQTNPTVRISDEFKDNVEVKSTDFIFALYFSNNELEDLDLKGGNIKDFFDFTGEKKVKKIVGEKSKNDILNFTKCNETEKNKLKGNSYMKDKDSRLNNTYCLQIGDFSLQNSLNEIPKRSLSINVRKIKNTNETGKFI